MAGTLYIYSALKLKELDILVEAHKASFDELVGDTFSDDELIPLEVKLDAIAAVYVQPLLSELIFDDFNPRPDQADEQRRFFVTCQSAILLEQVPYFENNPFQVTYLLDLLERVGEVLIDRGGLHQLLFKEDFIQGLRTHQTLEALVPMTLVAPRVMARVAPVEPIDFLVLDVYRELTRITNSGLIMQALEGLQHQTEKTRTIFFLMREENLEATALFRKSFLSPKDFDDYLEKLKLYLKKIQL